MRKLIFFIMPFILCQCASMEKSVGLGVGIGAATGIAAAQMAHYNTKGNVVLGLSSALIGAAIAAILHKEQPQEPVPVPITNLMKTDQPPLAGAEKDVLLVPDKIEGDHFVEKHRVWTIKKPARWQLPEGKESQAEEESVENEQQ